MIQSMDVQLGCFHDVVAVGMAQNCLSILDRNGVERLLPLRPLYNPRPVPIQVYGEFGEFDSAKEARVADYLDLEGITAVEIRSDFDDPSEDFHTRLLRLHCASGLNLNWRLFCDGKDI